MESESPAWYCVRTRQKQEHIAAANLRQIERVQVFSPRIKFRRATQRGPVWFAESLFPSYIFARFALRQLLGEVRHTTGVSTVVHFADRIPNIADHIIAELRATTGDQELIVHDPSPEAGHEVRIATGPFQGLLGTLNEVLPASERVRVLLEILGRQIAVELSSAAILPADSRPRERLLSL
jgi:transcriptional antiterminator RfaH